MNIQSLETMVRHLCNLTTDQVFDLLATIGFSIEHPKSKTKRYAVRQGSTIDRPLIVCHADTVLDSREYAYDETTGIVVSAELDDRLGIAVMLCLLADGVDIACLVCDNEETGNTTARQFVRETELQPVWLTEFDRRGSDVVCYEYETPILCSLLEHCGFTVGRGSFSDISEMESLGVIGFNVGVGYQREHSLSCHARLHNTLDQVSLWMEWYNWLSDVRLAHEQKSYSRYDYYGSSTKTVRYSSSFADRYTSKILDNPRVDDAWDDDLYDRVDSDTDIVDSMELDSLELEQAGDYEECDNCAQWCHSDIMCDFAGGSVCENCIVDLKRGMTR